MCLIPIATGLAIAGIAASAGTSIAGSVMAKKAANAQAKAVKQSTDESVQLQRDIYNQNRTDLAPWRDAGGKAITELGSEVSPGGDLYKNFGASDFTADPGYDFRIAEGAKALQRSAAAKGSLYSGGTLKALTRFNQGFASNEFENAYNRFQANRNTRFNQLASVAGSGQNSANTTANLGANFAANAGNTMVNGAENAANAKAAGTAAVSQSINNGVNNGMNWYLLSQLGRGGNTPNTFPYISPQIFD